MPSGVFHDNVVVITGGSAGIGLEIARRLAADGASLVLAARNQTLLEQAANAIRAPVLAIVTDVAQKQECERLIRRSVERFGRIDTLILNAGISMHARFDELNDLGAVDRIVQTNLLGPIYCTHYALSHLKHTRGRIVAVSSLTGKTGVPMRTVYAATKHGMAGFFDSLRIELARDGVSVTVAYPGFVNTDIATRAIGAGGKTLGSRPVRRKSAMPVEECARQIIQAAARRRRELVMRSNARAGQLLKVFAPALVDRIAERTIERGR